MRSFSSAWWRHELREGRPWWLWPYSLALTVYFAGGLVWCLYKNFWLGAAFSGLVLTVHILLFVKPSRAPWTAHHAAKRT